MNYRTLYIPILFLLFLPVKGNAQIEPFKIIDTSINFHYYPQVNFKFWTRSIRELDTDKILLKENDKKIEHASFTLVENNSVTPQNKIIFILIENHYLHKGIKERAFFNRILSAGLKGKINKGDRIIVGTFDWYRNDKYVFIQNANGSDNENEIINIINNIQPPEKLFNKQSGADIYNALDETIRKIVKIRDSLPKNILLLSDDYPNVAGGTITTDEIRHESIKFNIPIYAIGYDIGAERYSLSMKNEICLPTNGAYFSSATNDENNAAMQIGVFLEEMNRNSCGKIYNTVFTSAEKRAHEKVKISIGTTTQNTAFITVIYPFNVIDWVKLNPILTCALFLAVIVFVFLIIILIRTAKRKKIKRILQEQENELQLRIAKEEMEGLRQSQIEYDRKAKQQISQIEDADKLQRLKKLMKLKGVSPRVTYEYKEQRGQFFITIPTFNIGRDEADNDFFIKAPSISRNHAKILFNENGSFLIEDMNSTNGTIINGSRVPMAILKNGDTIRIGEVMLKINL